MANKKECPYRKELDFSLWCKRTCRYCTLEQHETCKVKKEAIKITNADRIRSMTDEGIANFITNIRTKWIDEYEYVYVIEGEQLDEFEDVVKWLKSEVGCEQ